MHDLYPVSLSARSSYVKFTNEVVEALSAQRHLDRLMAPVIVAHGTLENAGISAPEPRVRSGS
jgi:arylformamidase